jgi:NADH-quinone oxidoreductase subunit L
MSTSFTFSKNLLLAVPLAPLIGAIVAGLFGRWVGRRGAHSVTILGVLIAFVLSAIHFKALLLAGADVLPIDVTIYEWMQLGPLKMEVGFLIDKLSGVMMCVVTFVSLMVHIYTIGYMKDDPGYQRFFSYISLFTFAMLMLVMSNNLLQLFFGWEAVGVISYLLIGFWFTKPSAIVANMKAFLVNRVGDFGFILGIGLLVAYTGTLNYHDIFTRTDYLNQLLLPGTSWLLVTVVCICLFIGAMGKSAQFPLHVWLPDSMEGPTPISALIHAATMVTAGIFMVARMSPVFELSDVALNFIMVIGAITALFMGFLGIIQNDIKRVVAYSTLSQLGYMTVALGASAYSVAVFHLLTHAFFKALLFLAAGSVIVGMHHDQDIRNMGGLRKYMPLTWITSLLGSLALIGTPFFAGFYSKDSIIEAVKASDLPGASFAYAAVLVGVFITAFYSFRMYFLVFHGPERFRHKPFPGEHDDHQGDHHSDALHSSSHAPHESPWVITLPLVLLAIPSVFTGYFAVGPVLSQNFFKGAVFVNEQAHHSMQELAKHFHDATTMALHALSTEPFWAAFCGVLMAYVFYVLKPAIPAAIKAHSRFINKVLENKYFFDWFNEHVLAAGARLLGRGLWKVGDVGLIDGVLVNGSARAVRTLALGVRRVQTGHLYWYALVMILGVVALMTWQLWPYLPRLIK